jgi:hypothetical protein
MLGFRFASSVAQVPYDSSILPGNEQYVCTECRRSPGICCKRYAEPISASICSRDSTHDYNRIVTLQNNFPRFPARIYRAVLLCSMGKEGECADF